MSTPRERAKDRTLAEIRAIAWRQLESEGAAALSLRAISRELGLVSSAIYRYVPSRDDLLTELIVEGFTDLAVRTARADAAATATSATPRTRWLAIAEAMREWALERPAAWSLLYGSPVPGYRAPAARTTVPGTRTLFQLATVVAEADSAGQRSAGGVPADRIPAELRTDLVRAAQGLDVEGEPAVAAATILGWTTVVATISSELFGQLGDGTISEPGQWARVAFENSADQVGLMT